jgi:hypothetical protein
VRNTVRPPKRPKPATFAENVSASCTTIKNEPAVTKAAA